MTYLISRHQQHNTTGRWWPTTEFINTRDLGGLPAGSGRRTRFGVVLRCAAGRCGVPQVALDLAERNDHQVHLFDLRFSGEIDGGIHDGENRTGACSRIVVHDLSLGDPSGGQVVPGERDAEYFVNHYVRMIPAAIQVVAALLQTIAENPGPAVIACRLGKDRTGIVSLVLLKVVGVPDHWVLHDFLATGRSFLEHPAWVAEYAARRGEDATAVFRRLVLSPSVARRVLTALNRRAPTQAALRSLVDIDEKTANLAIARFVEKEEEVIGR
jgi:Tyrosine phosphatase family